MTDYKSLYEHEVEMREMREFDESQRQQSEYEARQRQRQQIQWEVDNTADTWSQAFARNERRLQHELQEESALRNDPEFSGYPHDSFWENSINANRDMQLFLAEENERIASGIAELERLITEAKRQARLRAYGRLQAKYDSSSVCEAFECVVDGHPSDLLDW